ncbi:MAG: hypothetical protein WA821_04340 [Anaerolineales bacterium]
MSSFRRYLLILCLLAIATSVYIPLKWGLPYPKAPGPKLGASLVAQYKNELNKSDADLALIGDSVLFHGVIPDQMAALTGRKIYKFGVPGTASAAWYLMLKNVIAAAAHKPRYLVVTFRDTILTVPDYRVNGKYLNLVSRFATSKEPLFIQRSFIQQMSPVEQLADQYLPIYGSRLLARDKLNYFIRYSLPAVFGCNAKCTDKANIIVFRDNNLGQNSLTNAAASAEAYLYTPDRLDFSRQLDQSFLPEMVRIARENKIQLILVRTKHLNAASEKSESAALKNYIQALKTYAAQNNVIVLDFAYDKRLTRKLYYDNYHTTMAGAVVFTKILSEALLPIINK